MWYSNCRTVHDPAFCIGPLVGGVLKRHCLICGDSHVIEDCAYKTPTWVYYVLLYCRQGRCMVTIRIDLSHVPLHPVFETVASQGKGFATENYQQALKRAIRRNEKFDWKSQKDATPQLLINQAVSGLLPTDPTRKKYGPEATAGGKDNRYHIEYVNERQETVRRVMGEDFLFEVQPPKIRLPARTLYFPDPFSGRPPGI
ncbi:Uu.00g125470.m01.CDS01 [Anthostomella pinea]|uniref:Uu.00g125470.m01.CDS01 n=1 Tax=Anthostomella pinea TaxID=933095 RepID=A0AAI8VHP3_9PEZI|nr:Uu.00g125470.m01.CDS01 [Anthostomella pinea]